MFHRILKWTVGALAAGASIGTLYAQMAQDPLLSRTAAVEPNIVFLFDDSASMQSTAIYQYGIGAGYQGNRGPNGDAECLPVQSGCVWTASPPATVYGQSPDTNLIYYDPRVRYVSRVQADGSSLAATLLPNTTTFNVYFYKPGSVTTYKVDSVAVGGSGGIGYPATGLTGTLPAASGGAATVRVNVVSTNLVSGVTPDANHWYPTSPGTTVTINSPATGGIQATATAATTQINNGITSVANNNSTFNVASGTSCSVTSITGGGTGTSITPVLLAGSTARKLSGFTITNPGSGFTLANPVITVKCGSAPTVNYTATRGNYFRITSVTMVNKGRGYSTTPPGVSFPAAASPGITATGTASTSPTTYIGTVDVLTPGAGYTACPTTVTLSNNTTGGTGATFTPACSPVVTANVNRAWDGTLNPNGLAANKGPINAGDYFASYVPDAGSPLAAGATTTVPYPVAAKSAVTQYPKFRDRTDCAGAVCTWAEELANYSTWKAFHSNRLELAKTGIGLAFQPLNPTFRLGWGTLGNVAQRASTSAQCGVAGTGALTKGVRLFNGTTQGEFLTWLYGINNAAASVLCTPSRIAVDNVGKYFQRADANSPWANAPNGDGAISVSGTQTGHATCRRSYSMLMTDGYYNDTFTLTGQSGDYDSTNGTAITQPRSYTYVPTGPFSDTRTSAKSASTLADVAMKYWVTDLRTDLSNAVRPVTGDDGFWQHMNFYAIGLGLVGTLDATRPSVLQGLSGNSPTRTADWPAPSGDSPLAIDDMWHATVNGRGKLLNAKTAAELNSSIQQMMSDIAAKEGTQAGVAVSTISLTRDTRKYTPTYTPITWTGNVTAFNLDQTSATQASVAWEVETLVSVDTSTGAKVYSSRIPAANLRKIFVGNGAVTGTRAVPFTYTSLSSAGLLTSMGAGVTTSLVDYLRGDASMEDNDVAANSPTAIYRARQTRLADIVNSTPVFVKDTVDLKYDTLPSTVAERASYRAFVTAKKARPEGVLFVGANDGMLHAFRDGTYDTNGAAIVQGGAEVFAYVPNALLPTLKKLSDKAYVHQYYVDGPNSETDAFLPVKNRWANVVMGSTGAGAGVAASSGVSPRSAVFAIDATSLNSGTSGMDATSVLWEASSNQSDYAELGHVLTDVQAGVTIGGQWVAIFGNGYESKSCTARLYVVNIETGARIREINTGIGGCSGTKNGLGGVRLVKNANQQVIGVYAGDLLGNMWKFNLNASNPSSWNVDLSGSPLFTAGATRPITAPPSIANLPITGATDPKPGYMVVFGSGKFYEVTDITSTAQQTLYGVWDKQEFGATPVPSGAALTNTTQMVMQTISAAISAASGNNFFEVSKNAVDYASASPKRGWYINLPKTGQRLVYPIDILSNRFAVADTISPANVSLDPCSNESGGSGYIYIIDMLTGAGPTEAILDTNGDGNVGTGDLAVSGLESSADGRNVSIIVRSDAAATTYANVGGGAPGSTIVKITCTLTNTCSPPPDPPGTPTTSSTKGVRHQWRQLFLR
jgi:type IV pilus assembly protein PilY1